MATVPCVAFAGGENRINTLKASWKSPTMTYCLGSNMGDATIGRDRETCKGNYSIDANSPGQCVLVDDMGVLMLVAREVNENGARFCITTIYAEHKKKGNAWTLYAEPAQGSQQCHWLCKPGFSGEGCANTTPTGCDSTPFRRDDFNSYTMARDPQVESAVAMFHWNEYKGCGVHKGQEHDMILAVSDWLDGGHGAWARPFVIRARREGWKSVRGGIEAWPAAEATLLCKNGYTANAAGTDCIPVDETACALAQTCSNWPSNGFDSATMIMEYNNNMGCYQYRCRESGYAFPSTTNRTCQECALNMRGGPSPVDGTCIKCDVGQIFDEKASATGFCIPTDGYTKTDLQYGKAKTKSDQPDVSRQCWTIQAPDDYKICVTSGGVQTVIAGSDEASSSGAARSARRPVRR